MRTWECIRPHGGTKAGAVVEMPDGAELSDHHWRLVDQPSPAAAAKPAVPAAPAASAKEA